MTLEEMYNAVRNGTITFKEFEEWVDDQRADAYSNGCDETNYQNAMNG